MRALRVTVLLTLLLLTLLFALSAGAFPAVAADGVDLGRQVLPANDGWGSAGPGVTGGSSAVPAHVYTVTNRQELIAA